MSRAPQWAQELIGFDRPSILTRNLIEPALRLDARRLRANASSTPRCKRRLMLVCNALRSRTWCGEPVCSE
jgi:hypothetical protein